eukprot:243408-Prymnesium_polylepis.2
MPSHTRHRLAKGDRQRRPVEKGAGTPALPSLQLRQRVVGDTGRVASVQVAGDPCLQHQQRLRRLG